jgi:DNA processing protein
MTEYPARYVHALRNIPGIGDQTVRTLLNHFGNGENIWRASESDIFAIPQLGDEKKRLVLQGRKALNPEALFERLHTLGITAHQKTDAIYPRLLKEIPDAPLLLYTRGNFSFEHPAPLIALVGSRKHSAYGLQVAERLASDLTRAGMVVVSGMAFGIDSVAHKSALDASGETLAVLGSGIDDSAISPVSHCSLAQNIMRSGALVSEYPPGTRAHQ